MTVKYLYYTEDSTTGGSLSAAHAVPWLDQILYMYGGERMCIHPSDADYDPTADESYHSLDAAMAKYPDHKWIFLNPNADVYLDEIEHPLDNVVYAVGHDATGFGRKKPKGTHCRLRTRVEQFEGHAIACLSVACIDRWMRAR